METPNTPPEEPSRDEEETAEPAESPFESFGIEFGFSSFEGKNLRIGVSAVRHAQTATFWDWAEAERERAPGLVVPLIDRQRDHIDVTDEEGVAIADWARGGIGWDLADPKPLRFRGNWDGRTIDPPTDLPPGDRSFG